MLILNKYEVICLNVEIRFWSIQLLGKRVPSILPMQKKGTSSLFCGVHNYHPQLHIFGNKCEFIIPLGYPGLKPFVGTWCHMKGHMHTYLEQQRISNSKDKIVVSILLYCRNCKTEHELPIKFHLSVKDKLAIMV